MTYGDQDELIEKIQHYLANEPERARIAKAGQSRHSASTPSPFGWVNWLRSLLGTSHDPLVTHDAVIPRASFRTRRAKDPWTRGMLSMSWRRRERWQRSQRRTPSRPTTACIPRIASSESTSTRSGSLSTRSSRRSSRRSRQKHHRRGLRNGPSPTSLPLIDWLQSRSVSSESIIQTRASNVLGSCSRQHDGLLPIFIPFRSTSASDLVICTEVLEHLYDPGQAVELLLSLCAHGGRVAITVPDGAEDSWEGHVNFWDEAAFHRFLEPSLMPSSGSRTGGP